MGRVVRQAVGGYGMTCLWGITPPLMAASIAFPQDSQRSTLHPAALALAFAASVGVPACWHRVRLCSVVAQGLNRNLPSRRGARLPGQGRGAARGGRRCRAQPPHSLPVAAARARRACRPCLTPCEATGVAPCNSLIGYHRPAMSACQATQPLHIRVLILWGSPPRPACVPLHVVWLV